MNSQGAENQIMEATENTFIFSPFKKGLAREIHLKQWEQR